MTTQIDAFELDALIAADAVKVIDGSWALDGTDMRALYEQEHIPGAQFFDIEAISDHTTGLPHMAPSPEHFGEAVGRMGVSAGDHVVIYDRQGLFSAARVWWTFTVMGHSKVQVLRGGLPAWKAAGFALEGNKPVPAPAIYTPRPTAGSIIDRKALMDTPNRYLVLDARSRARFEGTAPEPRAGLRSGHIPGSRSLPFAELIQDGALRPEAELRDILTAVGVHDGATVVTSCGSGVTAAIISMALAETGHTSGLLYDGSWAEWGQHSLDTPVVTGAS
ncbi:sulfurtransferase [Asticcacaulis biprosthecium]|nr:sulfurtransferase [Asticcacaulis biprosthecium]